MKRLGVFATLTTDVMGHHLMLYHFHFLELSIF